MGHVGSERDRTVYVMTKHALEGLTKAMAVELAPKGVRVVSIAPTFIDTPLVRPFFDDPTFRQWVLEPHPDGKARHRRGGRVRRRIPRIARRRPRHRLVAARRRRLDRVVIGRRALILGLGGAIACPSAARAQQKAIPVIGYLASSSPGPSTPNVAAFRQGLTEAGYVDGRNVAIEYRWAEGSYDRLPALAADLVGRKVDVIVASGSTPPALPAKSATSTIPIVFTGVSDPVEARPGCQSRPAGRQRHRLYRLLRRADGQAARIALRAGSSGESDRPAGEPERSGGYRTHNPRRSGGGACQGGTTPSAEGRHRERDRRRLRTPSSTCMPTRSSWATIRSSAAGANSS